jgi:hypothetical protein
MSAIESGFPRDGHMTKLIVTPLFPRKSLAKRNSCLLVVKNLLALIGFTI